MFQLQDVSEQRTYNRGEETNNFFGHHNSKPAASLSLGRSFVVKEAPWDKKAPDTTSTADFPSFRGGGGGAPQATVPWGPRR